MPAPLRDADEGARDQASVVLSACIVIYRPDPGELAATIESLARAAGRIRGSVGTTELTIVDNTEADRTDPGPLRAALARIEPSGLSVRVIAGHGNVGFGPGHNLALDRVGRYHLILNPDVEMQPDALANGLDFLRSQPDCGLLSPAAFFADGTRQYLCKRYPAVLDLLLRGFAPSALRRRFTARLDRYEMRDRIGDKVVWDPPIVSGCFMLFRGNVFRELGGFDPRFFLYFEDFDLSLRAGRVTRLAYVPSVRIVHHGGHAARKGLRHVRMFGRSAFAFFSKHGWRWF